MSIPYRKYQRQPQKSYRKIKRNSKQRGVGVLRNEYILKQAALALAQIMMTTMFILLATIARKGLFLAFLTGFFSHYTQSIENDEDYTFPCICFLSYIILIIFFINAFFFSFDNKLFCLKNVLIWSKCPSNKIFYYIIKKKKSKRSVGF